MIISKINALMDTLEKEKEIRSLKKELAAQRKLTKELEVYKIPSKNLIKVKPLINGMMVVK